MSVLTQATDACRETLTQQRISPGEPGSILTDVHAMLDVIGIKGLPTKSKQGNLPVALLPELNARLSQPLELHLNRAALRDYPNLAGPYVVLRVMDLVRLGGGRVWVNEEALNLWSSLNPTEQYFALMEAWLIHAGEEVLTGKERRSLLFSQLG